MRRQSNPDGTRLELVYDDVRNTVTKTDENGYRTRVEHTPLGSVVAVYDADNEVKLTDSEYDAMGRLTEERSYHPDGRLRARQITTYDVYDRVLSKELAGSGDGVLDREDYVYNDAVSANEAKITKTHKGDAAAPSVVTSIYTDKLGRTTKEVVVDNGTERVTEYTYDYVGNKLTVLTPLDRERRLTHTTKWEYDYAGRVLAVTNALGQVARNEYDPLGNLVAATDIAGGLASPRYATQYTYDQMGRVLVQKSPFERRDDGIIYAESRMDYNPAGQIVRHQTAMHRPGEELRFSLAENCYDLRGRLVETVAHGDGDSRIHTRYEYDGVGNQTLLQNGANVVSMEYDRFGNLTLRTDALGQAERYVYDAVGMLVNKTDRNGNVSEYTHDDAGRLVRETVTDPEGNRLVSEQGYTLTGQSGWMRNEVMRIDYRYDCFGRHIAVNQDDGVTKSYAYDLGGNRTAFSLSKGSVAEINLSYAYDELDRLAAVRDNVRDGVDIARYTYDPNGNRQSLVYSQSDMSVRYAVNPANLVTSIENVRVGQVLSSWAYEYQLDGNQVAKTDRDGNRTEYQYDRLGQLIREDNPLDDSSMRYRYDGTGNRERMEVSVRDGYETDYEYDASNRLLRTVKRSDDAVETTVYAYDANGNQIRSKWTRLDQVRDEQGEAGYADFADGEQKYDEVVMETRAYDGRDQLVRVFRDGQLTCYRYRPDGLRYSKATGTAHRSRTEDIETVHHWDGQQIVMETAGNDVVKSQFLRGMELIACNLDDVLQYFLYNAHGDVVHRMDRDGNVLRTYEYDAFGVEVEPEPLDFNPFRYCGEYYDRETDTVYLRARFYKSKLGRFASEDPARSQVNWYIYCTNNPRIAKKFYPL